MVADTLSTTDSRLLVLSDDLKLFTEAIMQNQTNDGVIYSNRFSADVLVFFPQDTKLANGLYFVGAAMRNIAEQLAFYVGPAKPSKDILPSISDDVSTFATDTASLLPSIEDNLPLLLEKYHSAMKRIVPLRNNPIEEKLYSKRELKLLSLRSELIRLLSLVQTDILYDSVCVGADGVINEFDRIMRSYGFSTIDLLLFTALKSFSWLDNYYKSLLAFPDTKLVADSDSKAFRLSLGDQRKNAMKELLKFSNDFESLTPNVQLDNTVAYVARTMEKWRTLFINYMDLELNRKATLIQEGAIPAMKNKPRKERKLR